MTRKLTTLLLGFAVLIPAATTAVAQSAAVVPGSGTLIDFVGDTMEQPDWEFIHNHPKSSREQDEQTRFPNARATNGRWFEGPERGQPDSVRVVPTPEGGLPGSRRALEIRTLRSGVPGRISLDVQQDDLIVDGVSRIGAIPVGEVPSIVARVYLPPADEWENRTGPHFGFRGTAVATIWKEEEVDQGLGKFRFRRSKKKQQVQEQFWPGIWVHFTSKTDRQHDEDSAFLTVRGNHLGHDFKVREISQAEFGWWTMGMSFTPDGRVHFYAKPGVDDLTADDHLTSQMPYSYRAERMENMFFDICNRDDGKSWSTPFVIDDPQLFVLKADRVVSIVNQKKQSLAAAESNRQAQRPQASKSNRGKGQRR